MSYKIITSVVAVIFVLISSACSDTKSSNVQPEKPPVVQSKKPIQIVTVGTLLFTDVTTYGDLETVAYDYEDPLKGEYEKTVDYADRLSRARMETAVKHFQNSNLHLINLGLDSYNVSYDADTEMLSLRNRTLNNEYRLALACAGGTGSGYQGPQLCAGVEARDATPYIDKKIPDSLSIPMTPANAKLLNIGNYNQKIELYGYIQFDPNAPWVPIENQNKTIDHESGSRDITVDIRRRSPFYETQIMMDKSSNTKYKTGVIIGDITDVILVNETTGEILKAWPH